MIEVWRKDKVLSVPACCCGKVALPSRLYVTRERAGFNYPVKITIKFTVDC